MLKFVTITGADDNVKPRDLHLLSKDYPFVEWGILFSKNKTGLAPRYPSLKWINELNIYDNLRLSMHVCGSMARGAAADPPEVIVFGIARYMLKNVSRVQLNLAFVPDKSIRTYIGDVVGYDKRMQVIFPVKNFDFEHLHAFCLEDYYYTVGYLHDLSGGRGIDGSFTYPKRMNAFVGFAGGITPENVESKIETVLGNYKEPFWIDAESGVRTENNQLDLDKVESMLKIAKKYTRT
jgi:hypothetical protein